MDKSVLAVIDAFIAQGAWACCGNYEPPICCAQPYGPDTLRNVRATVERKFNRLEELEKQAASMAKALEAMSADYNKALAIIAKHEGPVRSMLSDNAAAALRAYRGDKTEASNENP